MIKFHERMLWFCGLLLQYWGGECTCGWWKSRSASSVLPLAQKKKLDLVIAKQTLEEEVGSRGLLSFRFVIATGRLPSTMPSYTVTIATGDQWFAGTDDYIYITLVGTEHCSERTLLDKPLYNDFERGAVSRPGWVNVRFHIFSTMFSSQAILVRRDTIKTQQFVIRSVV